MGTEPVGARSNSAPEASEEIGRQETPPDMAQDFNRAPQSEAYESVPADPSEHDIRVRAYQRYLDRGGFDGGHFDDWLQAEMELKRR